MHVTHLFHTADFWKAHKAVTRDATGANILPLFFFHRDGVLAIQRITTRWTKALKLSKVNIYTGSLSKETWDNKHINDVLIVMQRASDESNAGHVVLTDEPPRHMEGSLVVVRTQGTEFIIDGRRPANVLRKKLGRYPVWIIHAEPPSR